MARRVFAVLSALALVLVLVVAGSPLAVSTPHPVLPSQTYRAAPDVVTPVLDRGGYGAASVPVSWPLSSRDAFVSSLFGDREPPTSGASAFHEGVDFGVGYGTAVCSVAGGVVVSARRDGGYGLVVRVAHVVDGVAVVSGYAHLADATVAPGQAVVRGELVGHVGSTGVSTGPHLHFELRVGGAAVDPLPWLYAYSS